MTCFVRTPDVKQICRILWAMLILLPGACAGTPQIAPHATDAPLPGDGTYIIYVMSNGWHTGIVLKRRDLVPGYIPESDDFPGARFLEFGWGDREYYPAKDPSFGLALQTVLVPTPSVVHVAPMTVAPAEHYPKAETIAVTLTGRDLGRLIGYLHASFERTDQVRAASSGPGLYTNSRFYPGRGKFHMFNTCNTWTARALAFAGVKLKNAAVQSADELMEQLRAFGGR